jgi:MoaA/NifB/PqqE/SkfB family radical SAM enzyme
MDLDLFREILAKADALPNAKVITFNSYNEPTICEHFDEMLRLLSETRLKLVLHTNGSRLDANRIAFLSRTGLAAAVIVNLPSLDPARFRALTGSAAIEKTLTAVEQSISAGLPVRLSVNGSPAEQAESFPALKARFGTRVIEDASSDRAGLLGGVYARNISITGLLRGCDLVDAWIHIAVNGNLFICCEDYYQNEVYGNVRDGSFEEILEKPNAVRLRRRVFGLEKAPDDFICRRCDKMLARFRE